MKGWLQLYLGNCTLETTHCVCVGVCMYCLAGIANLIDLQEYYYKYRKV